MWGKFEGYFNETADESTEFLGKNKGNLNETSEITEEILNEILNGELAGHVRDRYLKEILGEEKQCENVKYM